MLRCLGPAHGPRAARLRTSCRPCRPARADREPWRNSPPAGSPVMRCNLEVPAATRARMSEPCPFWTPAFKKVNTTRKRSPRSVHGSVRRLPPDFGLALNTTSCPHASGQRVGRRGRTASEAALALRIPPRASAGETQTWTLGPRAHGFRGSWAPSPLPPTRAATIPGAAARCGSQPG